MLLDLDLSTQVEDEKREGENNVCEAIRQIKEEERAEGRDEGRKQATHDVICNMLKKQLSLEEIAELTGVALEEIQEIANNL